MAEPRIVIVIDMQNGVFAVPRYRRDACVAQINRLTAAADRVIFVQHCEAGGLEADSEGFALLPELVQPANALYVTKTACDGFYHTDLDALLARLGARGGCYLRLRQRLLRRYHRQSGREQRILHHRCRGCPYHGGSPCGRGCGGDRPA